MVFTGSLQLSYGVGLCKNRKCEKQFKSGIGRSKLYLLDSTLSSRVSFQRQNSWSAHASNILYRPPLTLPYRHNGFKCHSFLPPGGPVELPRLKAAAAALTRSFNILQGSPHMPKLAIAAGITAFAAWGFLPLIRLVRNVILHKNDNSWKKSNTHYVMTSYLQPLLLWMGSLLICRALDPVLLPTETGQIVKQRLLSFVRSLSTVLAFAYCLSGVIQQTQKFFMETNDTNDTRNMGFQFAGKAVYSAVWIAAFALFMELLGFSTQKWVTAGGLGTVLLTLAGREIFTNFLSSAMIHATRPFVVNEWIQTKIEGYEVSGTVEHVGWWSPTIIRGEDREAVHIPNHKFTVNVVRNLTQKTHWRIKTHLAISHSDVHKINNIVADMRKVLAKNPLVEQQRLHRRVFLENINPENQALMILISCFVKTSHFEEYLCVKEAILLDLLRVVSHHRARLATPIRTVQKIYADADLENVPFADSVYTNGGVPHRPLLLIEPSYKISGEDKTKNRAVRPNGERDGKTTARPSLDNKVDSKVGATTGSDSKVSETPTPDNKSDAKNGRTTDPHGERDGETTAQSRSDNKVDAKVGATPASDSKINETQTPDNKADSKTIRTTNVNGERDRETSAHSPLDNKADAKVGATPASDSKINETPTPDNKADIKTRQTAKTDVKDDLKAATVSKSDPKTGDKVMAKSASKTDSKVPEPASESDPEPFSSLSDTSKQPKSASSGNQKNATNLSPSFSETGTEKPGALPMASQAKPESERMTVPKPPISKPVLEENIVLGVALEGSKRTLPIEDNMASPLPHAEVTELSGRINGQGSTPDKDKKDGQSPSSPSSKSVDQ